MIIKSVFSNNSNIPPRYTFDGININPTIEIVDAPENTKSFAIIIDDPDAVKVCGFSWVHWLVFNIPAETKLIHENSVPKNSFFGLNDFKKFKYQGPSPPKETGIHHYHFKLYALDTVLDLKESVTKQELENAMNNHIIEKAELIGTYSRDN
jgi:Raf kinase inhibitor-like YbhB/YbcL family protein